MTATCRPAPASPPEPDARVPDRPAVSPDWSEGRFFDRWMIVHFLSGVTGGLTNLWVGWTGATVLLVGLGLMVAWEVVEVVRGISESWENRLLDLVFGAAGIGVALALAARLTPRQQVVAFVVSAVLFAWGDFLGWRAYRRRVRATDER